MSTSINIHRVTDVIITKKKVNASYEIIEVIAVDKEGNEMELAIFGEIGDIKVHRGITNKFDKLREIRTAQREAKNV